MHVLCLWSSMSIRCFGWTSQPALNLRALGESQTWTSRGLWQGAWHSPFIILNVLWVKFGNIMDKFWNCLLQRLITGGKIKDQLFLDGIKHNDRNRVSGSKNIKKLSRWWEFVLKCGITSLFAHWENDERLNPLEWICCASDDPDPQILSRSKKYTEYRKSICHGRTLVYVVYTILHI